MGGKGNGLRSRGSQVRILPAAPSLHVVQGEGKGRAPVDRGAHLDRLAQIAAPETWRTVAGFDGRYEVSDRGRVRSLVRAGVRRRRLLKLHPNHRGYLRAVLTAADGSKRYARVHMLVAAAFIGAPPFAGATVDHLDRNKRNNARGNLEYVSRLENYRRHLKRAREALEDVLDVFASPVRRAAAR